MYPMESSKCVNSIAYLIYYQTIFSKILISVNSLFAKYNGYLVYSEVIKRATFKTLDS